AAPTAAARAARKRPRRGSAVNVARIIPVEYSTPTVAAPTTSSTTAAASTPSRLVATRSAGECSASALPVVAATVAHSSTATAAPTTGAARTALRWARRLHSLDTSAATAAVIGVPLVVVIAPPHGRPPRVRGDCPGRG